MMSTTVTMTTSIDTTVVTTAIITTGNTVGPGLGVVTDDVVILYTGPGAVWREFN